MQKITIYIKERKLYFYCIGALFLTLLSANMLLTNQKPAFEINETLVKVASVATLLFFGMLFFIILKTLIKGREGFLAGTKGIYDNSSALAFGFVPWEDVDYINVRKIDKTDYLLVHLNDVQKYKDGENEFLGKIIDVNMKLYKTPIAINSKRLRCNVYELEKTLSRMHKEFLNRQRVVD